MRKIIIYCDGAARGNPGPAGAGAVLLAEDGSVVAEVSRYLGETTNNQAEYQALIVALEEAKKHNAESVSVFTDSELMARQLKGQYRVKNSGLKPLFKLVINKLQGFSGYTIEYLPREKNAHADSLANRAIDDHEAL